jgi:hypothetical protein
MARYLIKTAYDSVDCDHYIMVSDTCVEVGYLVDGKFRYEKIVSDYFRIVDHYPEITEEMMATASKAMVEMQTNEFKELIEQVNSQEPPMDMTPEDGKEKKPKKGQLLYENASFYG